MACALYLRGFADDRRSVEALAAAVGRPYPSAHLKVQNFKSEDPRYTAKGRVGMPHGGAEVKRSWRRFAEGGEARVEEYLAKIYDRAVEKEPERMQCRGYLAPGIDREVKGKARVGQQELRNRALFLTGYRCCVTGNSMPELIIASHIKPWRASTPEEKTDIHNVLCLDRDLDGLFDAHRMTVTADLEVKYDPCLPKEIGEELFEANFARFDRLREDCISKANEPGEIYLALHNREFERKCKVKVSDL